MSVVYITEQGAALYKEQDRLNVRKGEHLLRWIHADDVEQLILMGNVALSAQCVTFLLQRGIDTVFLSYYGRFKGRLVGEEGKNSVLRAAQFSRLDDPAFRLELAKRFVQGKIVNGSQMLRRYSYHREINIARSVRMLKTIAETDVPRSESVEHLMGYEGIAAKRYFEAWASLLLSEDFVFSGRNRRPPRDEINAMLSLGYTLLMNQVMACVRQVGLDPYFGSLHALTQGRPSLVLDIMEEFRPLVDRMVLTLVNRKEMRKEHFRYHVANEEEMGGEGMPLPVMLSRDGMRKFIGAFSATMNRQYYYDRLSSRQRMRDIILQQARDLAAEFLEKRRYESFRLEN